MLNECFSSRYHYFVNNVYRLCNFFCFILADARLLSLSDFKYLTSRYTETCLEMKNYDPVECVLMRVSFSSYFCMWFYKIPSESSAFQGCMFLTMHTNEWEKLILYALCEKLPTTYFQEHFNTIENVNDKCWIYKMSIRNGCFNCETYKR